jgi:agmatinase
MMMLHATPFLAAPAAASLERSRVAILPIPYEGGVSYGAGAARGPDAIIEASSQVEFYDSMLGADARGVGIVTIAAPDVTAWTSPEVMDAGVESLASELVKAGKFVVALGGDHSVSPACVRAQCLRHETFGVVQFDAHADLRPEYACSPLSHACAMARIREITPHTLQLGVRSLCEEEAEIIRNDDLDVFSVEQLRCDPDAVRRCLASLPEKVYLTIDVDAFDWSVVWSTGTPEPGGLLWYETTNWLAEVFRTKTVIGVDVVELAPREGDLNSAFAVAKLVYHIIGLQALNVGLLA